MKTSIIIPARFASSRFPGKPLVQLKLPNGKQKSLIELSWQAAKAVKSVEEVYIATDDRRIAEATKLFGAKVIMTSEQCANGTERCAEAVKTARLTSDLIINLQGDAPLTPVWFVEKLIEAMQADLTAEMATPVLPLDRLTHQHFLEDRRHGRVGGTTAVFDKNRHALYFSKEVLPFIDFSALANTDPLPSFHHVGVYAYRRKSLADYLTWPPGPLEGLEGLEQLRFLENGRKVKCVEVNARGKVFWELNNPEDVARIESVIEV